MRSHLRLLVLVGDHDKLALQLRIFCEFLQNRSLDIGVSRNNVQEHTLEFCTLGHVSKYLATQILMSRARMAECLKDRANDWLIVQRNNGNPFFAGRRRFFFQEFSLPGNELVTGLELSFILCS
jgi:hypothetical protein